MVKGLDRLTKAEAIEFVQHQFGVSATAAENYLRNHIPKESYYQKKNHGICEGYIPGIICVEGGGW